MSGMVEAVQLLSQTGILETLSETMGKHIGQAMSKETLRDQLAGQAMAAMISTPRVVKHQGEAAVSESMISKAAYSQADAMMKEREVNIDGKS